MARFTVLTFCFLICTTRLAAQSSGQESVTVIQLPVPGTTTSVNTLNLGVEVRGPFSGSASSTGAMPFSGRLTLAEAIERGLAYNLGAIDASESAAEARAETHSARSSLLPQITSDVTQARRQINLAALGIQIDLPLAGFAFPTLIGPFNVVDARVRLFQSVYDRSAWANFRAAQDAAQASEWSARDAREMVVLAVGAQYLQVLASQARIASARAQLATAEALNSQTTAQHATGMVARTDVNRTQVEVLTGRQRLVSLQSDLAKQKIALTRLTGLSPTDQYETVSVASFAAAPVLDVDAAIAEALAHRADLKAAEASLRAAERARTSVAAERLPTVFASADYGAIGTTLREARGTFEVFGAVRVPIWEGGRIEAALQRADASLRGRRAEVENIRAQIVADVRNASLEVEAAASQVELARTNLDTTRQTLELTRERFQAGITDSLEVVRTQESVASADLDLINSIFAHNVAKLALARAVGAATDHLPRFLSLP
jgi:outer membrane protein TolC